MKTPGPSFRQRRTPTPPEDTEPPSRAGDGDHRPLAAALQRFRGAPGSSRPGFRGWTVKRSVHTVDQR